VPVLLACFVIVVLDILGEDLWSGCVSDPENEGEGVIDSA
jgi:hypothetical protein